MRNSRTLAVYYEHPDWFRPLFAELDRRAVPFVALDATRHSYDPRDIEIPYAAVFNRMSPSAYLRGHGHGIFYTLQYLNHLENAGIRVINGQKAFAIPKAVKPEHIRENRAAHDLVLTDHDLEELDKAFPPPKRKIPLETL